MHLQQKDERIEAHNGRRPGCSGTQLVSSCSPQSQQPPAWNADPEKLKLVGALTGSLAHDFSNPLCGVRSVLERFSRKSDLADTEKHLVQLALQQCEEMNIQLQDLQDFVHARPGKRSLFDFFAVMTTVLRLMHKQLKLSRVVVHPLVSPSPIMLDGCEDQITQVLLHFLVSVCRWGPCTITPKVLRQGNWLRLALFFEVPEEATDGLGQFFAEHIDMHPNLDSGMSMAHSILKDHGGALQTTAVVGGCGECVLQLPIRE